jgi:hypothetical protein
MQRPPARDSGGEEVEEHRMGERRPRIEALEVALGF